MRNDIVKKLHSIFNAPIRVDGNFIEIDADSTGARQQQTNDVFSDKWQKFELTNEKQVAYQFQRDWYLKLYGFATEDSLRDYLISCNVIFDAGCGLGYKSAWFARLAPHALVVGMDFSSSAKTAANIYVDVENLFFIQGDIGKTRIAQGAVDYVSCDQVIMHTENPELTFKELARICTENTGQLACYFYAKKALPRELLDDYFRERCRNMTMSQLWEMSEQLTELGRRLSELNIDINVPEIPALGIKGGKYDLQRFIYWNFLKCFWNTDLGLNTSVATNFDWYSPTNAKRFSLEDVKEILIKNNALEIFFHQEEACYSGRFKFLIP